MTSRERFTLTPLNLAFRAYAVVALPATYGTVSNHGVLAWYFVPLILSCRFGVVVLGFVLTLAFSGIELWVGNTQAPLYGLLLLALFVGYCAWRGKLLVLPGVSSAASSAYTWCLGTLRSPLLLLASLTLTVALLLRSVPALEATLWAFCVGAVGFSIPVSRVSSPVRERVATIALGIGACLFSALLLEAGARLLLPPAVSPSDMYEEDARYIFTLRPGSEGEFTLLNNSKERISIRAAISPQGVRNCVLPPKRPREFRIVAIGDSYTMGHGIPEGGTVPCQLEKLLKPPPGYDLVTVVNCGVGGYAPWQERGFLNARGFSFEPDLVILQVLPSNDVAGSLSRVGKYLRAPDRGWETRLSYLRRQSEPAIRAERWLEKHVYAYNAIRLVLGEPHLATMLLRDCRFWPPFRVPVVPPSVDRNPYREASLIETYPELEQGYELLEQDIRGIKADCESRGVDVIGFAIPFPMGVLEDGWRERDRQDVGKLFELDKDVRRTNEIFDRAQIPHVDIASAMEADPNPVNLYYIYDGHWTIQGAGVAAKAIGDFLEHSYFSQRMRDAGHGDGSFAPGQVELPPDPPSLPPAATSSLP